MEIGSNFQPGYAHILVDHYVRRLREIRKERAKRLKAIRNRRQAETYQEEIYRSIKKLFSPLPGKTPLKARTTGILERSDYRIEKVIFESRPSCLVTANLYLPARQKRPAAAVLAACGHALAGKAEPRYQEFCQRLVRAGFIVFIYDPFSQGERDQYFYMSAREHVRKSCTLAHNMIGTQLELVGEWFGTWCLWDGIRALDYLFSRPEVDHSRIGITGNSGGGTITTWLWSREERFTMAAPSCFLTTFLANLENELPSDSEQYPPGILADGLEQIDFILVRAPKPVLLLGQKYDYFDRRGLQEAYAEALRFYSFFNAEKNLRIFIGNNPHGYFPDAQEKMVRFFCKHSRQKYPTKRVPVKAELPEKLFATRQGQVVPAGSKTVSEITSELTTGYEREREKIRKGHLADEVAKLLKISRAGKIPHYRILRPTAIGKKQVARYAVETEDDVRVIVHKVPVPKAHLFTLNVEKSPHLYLPHMSSKVDLKNEKLVGLLMKKGPLYLVDVRGFGESLSDNTSGFPHRIDYFFHGYSIMLGESFLGSRVYDILRVLDLFVAEGAKDIHLYGRAQGAIIALFAAILHPVVKSVTLKNAPLSYHGWVQQGVVAWQPANIPFGILREFDLPDCLDSLGKKVTLIEPWDSRMRPLSAEEFKNAMKMAHLPQEIFTAKG